MPSLPSRYAAGILLILTVLTSKAYEAGYYRAVSALADGRWVKVAVDTTGVYEISDSQLREWGFANPAEVHVYGYGGVAAHEQHFDGTVPDALPIAPSVRTTDGRLVFYAEGPVRAWFRGSSKELVDVQRNPYSRQAYYLLTDKGTNLKPKTQEYASRATDAVRWHYAIDLAENELTGFNGGSVFHGRPLSAGESETTKFRLRNPGWDNDEEPVVKYRVETAANTRQAMVFDLSFSDNVTVGAMTRPVCAANTVTPILYTRGEGYAHLTLGDSDTRDIMIEATSGVPASASPSYAAVDRSYIIYPRRNIVEPDMSELMLNLVDISGGENILIEGATATTCVWDVTNPTDVTILGTSATDDGIEATLTPGQGIGRRLVAFDPSARHRQVSFAGEIAGQNIHGEATPDMLIITTTTMLEAALELADIHRADGLDVLVVTQEAAFNEFGAGTPTPAALRRMVKMFYDRNPEKLRYLLLYGPSTCDPRFIAHSPGDYLLTHECDNATICRDSGANYASDMYYGMLSDNYRHQRIEIEPVLISVGRLSPTTQAQAREANGKIRAYLQSPPSPATMLRVVRSSDNDNDGIHLRHAQIMTDSMLVLNDKLTVTRADILYYPLSGNLAKTSAELIANSFKRGAGYFHYNGHGGYNGLAGEGIYNAGIAKSLKYSDPLLMMFSSCSAYAFDQRPNSLAEVASLTPVGGAIGCIGSSRSVYLDFNRILSLGVSRTYATAQPRWSGADVYREARNYLISEQLLNGDAGNNALCYNYAGDPAVPLPFAKYDIRVDMPSTGSIKSHSDVRVRAVVVDSDGSTVSDFDGDALIEVYDGPVERTPLQKVDGLTAEVFDDNLMGEYYAKVKDGIIDTHIVLPDAYNGDKGYRMTIAATNHARREYATGVARGRAIESAAPADAAPDTTAPAIIDFYIDDEAYIGPDHVRPDFVVHAVIDPSPSGIAMGNTGIRSKLTITMDDNTSYPLLQNEMRYDADGKAHVDLTVENISFGPHTLQLVVPNNAGQAATAYLGFNVATASLTGRLTVDSEIVRQQAAFDIDAEGEAHRLIITDAEGETVVSAKNPTFPYTWDLRDLDGNTVGDGHYKAWVILESDLARGATEAVEFTVIK